jgi:hypothetical protein
MYVIIRSIWLAIAISFLQNRGRGLRQAIPWRLAIPSVICLPSCKWDDSFARRGAELEFQKKIAIVIGASRLGFQIKN